VQLNQDNDSASQRLLNNYHAKATAGRHAVCHFLSRAVQTLVMLSDRNNCISTVLTTTAAICDASEDDVRIVETPARCPPKQTSSAMQRAISQTRYLAGEFLCCGLGCGHQYSYPNVALITVSVQAYRQCFFGCAR
jgi:hypothetical protein